MYNMQSVCNVIAYSISPKQWHKAASGWTLILGVLLLCLVLCSVERYDPSKDAWEMVAPMADKRINFGVGVMLGFIFVVGGHNGVSHLSSIERYDPHQDQWTACRPMNEPRTGESTTMCFKLVNCKCSLSISTYSICLPKFSPPNLQMHIIIIIMD